MRNFAPLSLLLLGLTAAVPATAAVTVDASASEQARVTYLVLVGEIAARSGSPRLASHDLLLAARATHAPELFERATEVAAQAGLAQQAAEAVELWRQSQPDAITPLAWQARLEFELGRDPESAAAIAHLLQLTPWPQRGAAVQSMLPTFERINDARRALALAQRALAEVDTLPQTWLVLGVLELRTGDAAAAFAHARRALVADPASAAAAALLLQSYRADPEQADSLLQAYFDRHIDAGDLRLAWVAAALDQQRSAVAAAQAQLLTRQRPALAEAWLLLGNAQLQLGHTGLARDALRTYFTIPGKRPPRAAAMAALELSQAALKLADIDAAASWLARIPAGHDVADVALQRALILLARQQPGQAQATVDAMPAGTPQQRRDRLLAQARLQHALGHDGVAWDLLRAGAGTDVADIDLLYEAALAAERVGDVAASERMLRQALVLDPHEPSVLNALGYTLVDQNRDLGEAAELIGQAIRLSPGNPFVMDSQGWLLFRQGQLDAARQILQAALRAQPDVEIQAHLAQVLWAQGDHQQAAALLRDAVARQPQAPGVRAAMQRLGLPSP